MSNIIKALRVAKGFTQEDVAKSLNMDKRTYCLKENKPESFSVGEISGLAEILEVDAEIFFKHNLTLSVS